MRIAIGGRISLMVGIASALIAVLVGTLYGSVAGYLGGKIDSVMMLILEILNSFPFMFFRESEGSNSSASSFTVKG